jgi:D-alanine-D-alanine ligase
LVQVLLNECLKNFEAKRGENMPKKIAVLFGGESAESFVSKDTAEGVIGALNRLGHTVVPIEFNSATILNDLSYARPDLVFNAMHGKYGEDGRLQGLLDVLKIPYTHSGLTPTSIGLNKRITKAIARSLGMSCARDLVISSDDGNEYIKNTLKQRASSLVLY